MRHEIVLALTAVDDLDQLSPFDRAAVQDALEIHLRHAPQRLSRSRIKRLRGLRKPQFRLLVSDIRVFYDVSPGVVEVLAIVPKPVAADWLARWGETECEESRYRS